MNKIFNLLNSNFIKIMAFGMIYNPLGAVWNPPVTISGSDEVRSISGTALSVNSSNNGVAVWINVNDGEPGFTSNVCAASYTFGSGWAPFIIVSPGTTDRYINQADPDVAINRNNYAVCVWEGSELINEGNDLIEGVFAATRASNGTWSSVQRASAFNTVDYDFNPENPTVAVNDSGLAVAVWNETRDGNFYHMANFLPFNGTWGTPAELDNSGNTGFSEDTARVAMDPNGNVVAVWLNILPAFDAKIVASNYNSVTNSWTTVILDPSIGRIRELPLTGIDDNGNAVAVWIRLKDSNYEMVSSSFTPGFGWGPIVVLSQVDSTTKSLSDPYVVMDRQGNSTAVWNDINDLNSTIQVYSSRLPLGGTWSSPVLISTDGNSNQIKQSLLNKAEAVNEEGDVLVLSIQQPSGNFQSIAWFNNGGWQAPENLFDPIGITSGNIAYGSCGFALANWIDAEQSGNPYVQAADNLGIFPPPTGFRGKKCYQKFVSQKVCVNVLNWCPAGPCILYYELYRDGTLIATIQAGAPLTYTDPCCNKCLSANYSLIAYNIYGGASLPVSLSVR